MRRVVLLAITSHWRRRPWQLLTLVIGLSMATALWSGVQAINAQARAGYDRAAALAQYTSLPTLQRIDGATPDIDDFAALRRAGWPVTPILSGRIDVGGFPVQVYGIDPFTHPLARHLTSGSGLGVLDLLDREQGAPVLGSPKLARRIGKVSGFPKVVENERVPDGQVIADISVAARLLGRPEGITALGLAGPPPGATQGSDAASGPDGFRFVAAPQIADVRGLTDSFHLNLSAFGALSFVVGLFIVHGGIGLAIEQRRATFRTMRAIGVPLATLLGLLGVELMLIAILSGGIGLVMGYFVAAALLPDVSATLRGLYGAAGSEELSLRPDWIVAGLALAVMGTLAAGADALIRVARMPLLAPAMPRAWARNNAGSARRLAVAGLALGVVGFGIGLTGNGLPGAFAMLGGLLLGAALILPVVLNVVLSRFARAARKPMSQWFWADSQTQLPGLSLALMALMLALATNIGVNTMVASFRQTFVGFLEQRLVSELYVTLDQETQSGPLTAWVAAQGGAVLPIWHVKTELGGHLAEVYGLADHPIYADRWPMLERTPEAWDRLNDGSAAFVSEQLARRAGIGVGDVLPLGAGIRVAGIYADYGNPGGQVAVSIERLLAEFPDVERRRFGILTGPTEPADMASRLQSEFALPRDAITDRATIRDFSLRVFERTFTVTATLNVLTLGISGFAILTSLLTLSAMRLPQLAPVWALGTTRARLAGIEVLRALMLACLTFVAALPVGLALAWVLLKVVNVEAFGWRLPMVLFPFSWLQLFALAVLAAFLSALWPAIRLARTSPARLTQVFAHE